MVRHLVGGQLFGIELVMVASTRPPVSLSGAPDGAHRDLQSPEGRSAPAEKRQRRRQADFDHNAGWCQSGQSLAHYRAIAARARWLHTQATTPRLKQYLERTIARSEELAGGIGKVRKPKAEGQDRREAGLRFEN